MDPLIWALLLFGLGLVAFTLEFFVPSAGMLGFLCVGLLIASIVFGFNYDWRLGIGLIVAASILLPVFFNIAIKIWPHTFFGKRILIGRLKREDLLPHIEEIDGMKSLVGRIGIAKSKMLPSGMIRIDDATYDAVADGFAIEAGERVQVTAVRNKRIIVCPADGDNPADSEVNRADPGNADLLSRPIEELGLSSLDDDPKAN